MSKTLNFEISKFDIEEISDSQFMKIRLYIVSNGNNRHNLPISIDTIQRAKSTLFGKPILFKYSKYSEDFEGHEKDEISAGCFIDQSSFSIVEDSEFPDKQWLVADGVIWKHYYPEVVKVFEKREDVAISMEIEVLEYSDGSDGFSWIKEFVFRGVTLLGKVFNPAIPDAKALVLSFSEMQEEAMKEFNIPMDVNLESNDAIKEVGQEEFSICGELDTQAVVESDKEGEQMKTVKDEFAVDTANSEDVSCATPEGDMATGMAEVCPTCGESPCTCPSESEPVVELEVTVIECEEVTNTEEMAKSEVQCGCGSGKSEVACGCGQEKKAFMDKIEALEAELVTLREFKATVERQEYEAKVDFAIDTVRADLTSEQVDEWREKSKEFASIDIFTNSLKAFAYDVRVAKVPTEKEEFSRMEVVTETITKTESKSIWA